ncbi:MAG: nuclear transport factor 2 family protein [Chitinophagaceae bacterium]|nr:nuclear transport factor 2 family protein [Chitinophagaceae bacterium]
METTTIPNPKEVVLGLLQALNDHDYKEARNYANPDMKFEGVLGSRDGAESYFTDMEKMQLEYNVRRIFVEGNDVCVLYDLLIEDETIFCCGWYQVKNGKISHLKVVFDPRPLLEAQKKASQEPQG